MSLEHPAQVGIFAVQGLLIGLLMLIFFRLLADKRLYAGKHGGQDRVVGRPPESS